MPLDLMVGSLSIKRYIDCIQQCNTLEAAIYKRDKCCCVSGGPHKVTLL